MTTTPKPVEPYQIDHLHRWEPSALRAIIAAEMAQGLLSRGGYDKWEYLATDSVNATDALLAELERTAKP